MNLLLKDEAGRLLRAAAATGYFKMLELFPIFVIVLVSKQVDE